MTRNWERPTGSTINTLDGGSSICPSLVDMTVAKINRYLFRDVQAFINYMGQFRERWVSVGFYFQKIRAIRDRESQRLDQYLVHWG
jgi:hypothetical protein